jgi:hypothetical protein
VILANSEDLLATAKVTYLKLTSLFIWFRFAGFG